MEVRRDEGRGRKRKGRKRMRENYIKGKIREENSNRQRS